MTLALADKTSAHHPDQDTHHGYWVLPGTKVPYLASQNAKYTPEEMDTFQQKLAALDEEALAEIWRDGTWLHFTVTLEDDAFNYWQFAKRYENNNFYRQPITQAFSPSERLFFLRSVDTAKYVDKPDIIVSVLLSLSSENAAKLQPTDRQKLDQFVLRYASPQEVKKVLEADYLTCGSISAELILETEQNRPELKEALYGYVKLKRPEVTSDDLALAVLYISQKTLSRHFSPKVFKGMLPFALSACSLENNQGAIDYAYKLAVIFNNIGQATNYLEKWVPRVQGSKQPVHDVMLMPLPEADDYDTQAWANAALHYGPQVMQFFGNAVGVERQLKSQGFVGVDAATPKQIEQAAKCQEYTNFQKNPAWGKLCAECGVSNRVFELGLTILAHVKANNYTPNIGVIDGATIGHPGYYMKRLDADDPRNLLIGKMVDCCNHIDGGSTAQMAKAHVLSPDGACYVIFKEVIKGVIAPDSDKPVAKATGWMSRKNNLVFNSWERLKGHENLCEPFLAAAAEVVLARYPNIGKVLLGRNRDGVGSFTPVYRVETPCDPQTASDDSDTQYLVRKQEWLKELDEIDEPDSNVEPESTITLWDAIANHARSLGMYPPQVKRLQNALEPVREAIERFDRDSRSYRYRVTENPRHGAKKFAESTLLSDLSTAFERDLKMIKWNYQRRKVAKYIYAVAVEYLFKDLNTEDFSVTDFLPSNFSTRELRDDEGYFRNMGGSLSIRESFQYRPRQSTLKLAIALSLGGAGLGGLYEINMRDQAYYQRYLEQTNAEKMNPGIFIDFGGDAEPAWTKQFMNMDITNLDLMRKTFGPTININGMAVPTEIFVRDVAPALNIMEEISKRNAPDKWRAALAISQNGAEPRRQ